MLYVLAGCGPASTPAASEAPAVALTTPVAGVPEPTDESPTPSVPPCSETVSGFSAAAVHAARDAAGPDGIVCVPAGRYRGDLTASVAGQTWRLAAAATLEGAVRVTARGVTISGGRSERATDDQWSAGIEVRANDVTVERMRFVKGGQGVAVFGHDRTTVRRNDFRGLVGSAVFLWGEGRGADGTVVERNTIVQTAGFHVSPIAGRGAEDGNPCSVVNRGTIIRNNVVDQGSTDVGWFGIEFKCHEDGVIEGNDVRGGEVLISLPDNNRMLIRNNVLHVVGTAYWGVEIAKAHDITVTRNRFIGSSSSVHYAVAENSDSQRVSVTWNHVSMMKAVAIGNGLTVTDNCVVNVSTVVAEPGSDVTQERNDATACDSP
jgi:hypothetical protein